MRSWTCVLDADEARRASELGARREAEAKRQGKKNTAGFALSGAHERGARCEAGFAKIMGLSIEVPFDTDYDRIKRARGDVGTYQVRSRRFASPSLIIRPNDDPEAIFVLVTEQPLHGGTYRITAVGWMRGKDARRHKWWHNPIIRDREDNVLPTRPAWFVPEESLQPMDYLPGLKEEP